MHACMCGKVVGMGRHREEIPYSQQTTVPNLQSKPDLPNTTAIFCRLSVSALRASMTVWENVHVCDSRCTFGIL